jgi:Bacterial membrane protein YfhO
MQTPCIRSLGAVVWGSQPPLANGKDCPAVPLLIDMVPSGDGKRPPAAFEERRPRVDNNFLPMTTCGCNEQVFTRGWPRVRQWFRRHSLAGQVLFVLVITLFSSFALAGHMLGTRSLYADNLSVYSIFRDNLHAANYYGEFLLWHPYAAGGLGFPLYYFSILGLNYNSPLFAVVRDAVWALGRVGWVIRDYTPFYIFYFSFLIPLLFEYSVLAVARQIFKSSRAILWVVALTAFSPVVVFNLSDVSLLELTAYAFFFCAAFLAFVRTPRKHLFVLWVLSALALAMALNHPSLFWNAIFVPLFMVVCLLVPDRFVSWRQCWSAGAAIPLWAWFLAFLTVVLALLPAAASYMQGSEILRTKSGTQYYDLDFLKSGNPLELLAGGSAGIDFNWYDRQKDPFNVWHPEAMRTGEGSAYVYTGLMTLPLALLGLVAGRRSWRQRFLVMLGALGLVVIMSAWSPLFKLILYALPPLRAVDHYSDMLVRSGGGVLMMIAAGVGVERLLSDRKRTWWWTLAALSLGCSIFSLSLTCAVAGVDKSFASPLFGLGIALTVICVLVWVTTALDKRPRVLRFAFGFLLVTGVADVSTVSFWHVRHVIWTKASSFPADKEPPVDRVVPSYDQRGWLANTILEMKDVRALRERNILFNQMPEFHLYTAARLGDMTQPPPGQPIDYSKEILLAGQYLGDERLQKFLIQAVGGITQTSGQIVSMKRNYNSLECDVYANGDMLLFWRDTYSPYWKAWVDGKPATLYKAFNVFKAVLVPAGKSHASFQFQPPLMPWGIVLSHAVLFLAAIACLVFWIWQPGATVPPARTSQQRR